MKKVFFGWTLSLSIFFIPLVSSRLFAKTEVFFSPGGMIRENIIKAIKSAERSIDIAVFTFTAGDIAEALASARGRGVRIRIVIDERQGKKGFPVLEFLEDEGLDVQPLKGNVGGFMHNTFAIFDDRLIVTGSYNWTEYAEKFNHENAIFIDDPDVIKRFHEEFELLYEKGKEGIKAKKLQSAAATPTIESTARSTKGDTVSNPDETHEAKEAMKGGKEGMISGVDIAPKIVEDIKHTGSDTKEKQAISTPSEGLMAQGFSNISFEAFDEIFGRDSNLGTAEKKRLWKTKFEGKYVRWTGKVCYKGISLYDWNKIGISHKGGDADVQLKFDWSKQQKVSRLRIGDMITYTGRLISLRGLTSPYHLIEGDVEE